MATLTITIDDTQLPRVVEALCVTGNVSPPTAANARQVVRQWIRRTTIAYEQERDQRAAVNAVPAPVDPGVT